MNSGMLPPTIFVIFGITGDLSRRKLLPSLEQIRVSGNLPKDFKILGISRRDISPEDVAGEKFKALKKYMHTLQMDMSEQKDYRRLEEKLKKMLPKHKAQYVFYLAVPPENVASVVSRLAGVGLDGPEVKLLLEKPFGLDYPSAKTLISHTNKHYKEKQIYRIDHYLAKEMAQNIVVFLNSNALFRQVWNNQFIEKIEIVAAESIGIEGRVDFYEQTGALRDLVQSHLMQLAALVLMQPCSNIFSFEEVPKRRLEALNNLQPVTNPKKQVIAGQYASYTKETAKPKSNNETFISLVLFSEDNRWQGVPIHLVTGKKLNQKLTSIMIHFKRSHHSQANLLSLRIQPNEAVEFDVWVKEPGYSRSLQQKPLSFNYGHHYQSLPEAYEQVIIDAFASNRSLFASGEEVLASWKILQPILDSWESNKPLTIYKDGSEIADILQ